MENIKDFYDSLNEYKNNIDIEISKVTDDIKLLLEDENVISYLNKIYQLQELNEAKDNIYTGFIYSAQSNCSHPIFFVENDIDGKICTCVLCQKHISIDNEEMLKLYNSKKLIGKKADDGNINPIINDYRLIDYIRDTYSKIYSSLGEGECGEDMLWEYYCDSHQRKRDK